MAAVLHHQHLLAPYLSTPAIVDPVQKRWQAQCSTYLPSDPNFLLDYMAGLMSDDSNDDFDGYLLSDAEPEENGNNDNKNTFINIIIYKYN